MLCDIIPSKHWSQIAFTFVTADLLFIVIVFVYNCMPCLPISRSLCCRSTQEDAALWFWVELISSKGLFNFHLVRQSSFIYYLIYSKHETLRWTATAGCMLCGIIPFKHWSQIAFNFVTADLLFITYNSWKHKKQSKTKTAWRSIFSCQIMWDIFRLLVNRKSQNRERSSIIEYTLFL